MWKQTKNLLPVEPREYPSGSFLKTEKGYFYVASSTTRFRIITKRLLDSWSPARVIETTESAVKKLKISGRLKYRNGSLIYNYANAKIYLISDGKRRHVQSPDVLPNIGATWKDVVQVSSDEINLHEEGEPIT